VKKDGGYFLPELLAFNENFPFIFKCKWAHALRYFSRSLCQRNNKLWIILRTLLRRYSETGDKNRLEKVHNFIANTSELINSMTLRDTYTVACRENTNRNRSTILIRGRL
jgi:hypothetical protein